MATDHREAARVDGPAQVGDGRRARRDRNKVRVLDAVIELFSEDQLVPSAHAVAARSGVSLRSIYRYFDDQDGLLRAAIDRHFERMAPLATITELGEGDLDTRIERLVTARLRLYRAVAPTARAARAGRHADNLIGREVARARHALLRQVEQHFAPELDALTAEERHATLAAVDVLCQHAALDHLDLQRRLSQDEIHDVLTRALRRLLTP